MVASLAVTARSALAAALVALAACGHVEPPPHPEDPMQSTHEPVDATLRMQVERTGSGEPLVLIGGGVTGSASWTPHAERLAPTREVARLQLLSVQYGLEGRPLPDGYSIRMESQALAAALADLGWTGPLDFAAWSYGGAVTLDFALNHPERIRTLTIIEPPALWVLPGHGRDLRDVQALEALLPEVTDEVTVETLERFLRTAALVPPGVSAESMPQWASWVRHRRSLRNGDAVFRHDDDLARLRAFDPPVLLVTGEGTSPFLRAVHDTLAETLPNASTLELPGAHAPHLVAMDEFLTRLAELHASSAAGGGAVSEAAVSEPAVSEAPAEPRLAISTDGTRIALWRSGSGPPVLLVHGATADHTTTWRLVRPDLERRFTVYAMDRRGRGGSGDASPYELRREAEDVAAVIEAIGEPVSVVGHSYGALVALEAALLQPKLARLILYEGVPLRGAELYRPEAVARLEALVEAGDLEGMLESMYRDLVEMSPEELELMRGQHDAWTARVRNARTLPRELEAERGYVFQPDRFEGLRTPTLLLVGGDSPPREMENARGVAEALPDARVAVLPGQQHAAMYTAPELLVRVVGGFLEAGG
jgi:pimeloyl-ACP methyl ester carboxylesterase